MENRNGRVKLDDAGNIVLEGGHTISAESLAALSSQNRSALLRALAGLNTKELESFKGMREWLNDDVKLAMCFQQAMMLDGSGLETIMRIAIKVRDEMSGMASSPPSIEITQGSVIIAGSPPISLQLVSQMSTPMTEFVVERFSVLNAAVRNTWLSEPNIKILFKLQSLGLFTVCKVSRIIPRGSAVLELNGELQISIHALSNLGSEDARTLFKLLGQLPKEGARAELSANKTKLAKDIRALCVTKHRLRFEYQRDESVAWMLKAIRESKTERALLPLVDKQLESFEKDRLYMAKSALDNLSYKIKALEFSSYMGPRNVSEMVAYCEFAITRVTAEATKLQLEVSKGKRMPPHNAKKSEWKTIEAVNIVFKPSHMHALESYFKDLLTMARSNDMFGVEAVGNNLNDADLVNAVRKVRVKFGSEAAAVYHAFKHPTKPRKIYVDRGNDTIRFESAENPQNENFKVTPLQDGDGRTITFDNPNGKCILLEKDGRVFLATYTPKVITKK